MDITYIKPEVFPKKEPLNSGFLISAYKLNHLLVLAENVGQSDFTTILGKISEYRKECPPCLVPKGSLKYFEMKDDNLILRVGRFGIKFGEELFGSRNPDFIDIELLVDKSLLNERFKGKFYNEMVIEVVEGMNQPPYLSIDCYSKGAYHILYQVLTNYPINPEIIDAEPQSQGRLLLYELLKIPMAKEDVEAAGNLLSKFERLEWVVE